MLVQLESIIHWLQGSRVEIWIWKVMKWRTVYLNIQTENSRSLWFYIKQAFHIFPKDTVKGLMNRDSFVWNHKLLGSWKGPSGLSHVTDGETKGQEEKLHSQSSDRGLGWEYLLATQDSSSLSTKPLPWMVSQLPSSHLFPSALFILNSKPDTVPLTLVSFLTYFLTYFTLYGRL